MKIPKLLPAAILIAVLVFLSQFAKTSTDGVSRIAAAETGTMQHQSQFRLKQSYFLGMESQPLLATVYSCGSGVKEKEVLSIWSREAEAYELQYIRTASNQETFFQPEIFSIEGMHFVKIVTSDRTKNQPLVEAVLSIKPDSTLHEIESKQVKELLKIHSQS